MRGMAMFPWIFGAALASAAAPVKQAAAMQATPARATVERDGVRLDAQFDFDAATQRLSVRYHLHNGSRHAIGVFDRGDTLAVKQGRLVAGTVAAPAMEQGAEGLTLQHRAMPLRRPAPTVPPIPLAARVGAEGDLHGQFHADAGSATRVRWCLASAAFDDVHFSSPQQAADIALWRASFAVVPLQQSLCTPWFDLSTRRFDD